MKMRLKRTRKSLNSQRDAVLWNNCTVQHPILIIELSFLSDGFRSTNNPIIKQYYLEQMTSVTIYAGIYLVCLAVPGGQAVAVGFFIADLLSRGITSIAAYFGVLPGTMGIIDFVIFMGQLVIGQTPSQWEAEALTAMLKDMRKDVKTDIDNNKWTLGILPPDNVLQ